MIPALAVTGPDGTLPPVAPPEVRLLVASEGPHVAPATVLLVAEVTDADGWVHRVEFFADNARIGVAEGDSRSMGPLPPFRLEWRHVLAGNHVLTARAFDNNGLTGDSKPVEFRVAQAKAAFLVIHHPEPGAVFQDPARVVIEATAVDPAADIRTVVFFANEERLGVSEFISRMAIIPGNPIPHRFVWENAPAGEYRIQALAEDLAGDLVSSETVPITIEPAYVPTVVSIQATRAEAVEGADGEAGRLAFRIVRSGPVHSALAVFYRLGGTATPGKDFVELPLEILIPEGREVVEFVVQSLADHETEGSETVVVELLVPPCIKIYPPPPGCYTTGHPAEAVGRIVDKDGPPPVKPIVSIRASVPETLEPSPETRVQPGRFEIHRTGPVAEPLSVVCLFGGTASREADYRLEPVPGALSMLTIPAGKEALEVLVGAVDDDLVEGDETVVAELAQIPLGAPEPEPGQPYEIDSNQARATVVIHDNDTPSAAELVILHPPPGLIWPEGVMLPIDIVAIDPAGYIPRVEVFAGDTRIGVSEIAFFVAPPPGTPIEHHIEWNHPPVGFHVLRAVAVNSAGEKVTSEPVHITVEPSFQQVVLEVTASHPATGEPGPLVDPVPAAFVVRRSGGPLDVNVHVFFQLGGTATEGEDYRPLPRDLVLEAGRETLEIPLVALPDDLPEGEETVGFELEPPACPAIYPPPPGCYRIGEKASARIVIHDSPPQGNLPPEVVIVRPRNGAVVPPEEPVEIVAEAGDRDGHVMKLALLLNGDELAITEGNRLATEWTAATPGEYVLTAVAIDNEGARGTAGPVKIFVREATILSFVRRDLPAGYLPGRTFGVLLEVLPPDHGVAWAVEDQPPAGWHVNEVSDHGVFDPATRRVKFGPFLSREPRRLAYRVTPPDVAAGRHEFAGHGSVDGASYPITGDRIIHPVAPRHPADNTPPEMALTLTEVTAYTAAWKQGHEWPLGPNPIPLSYVTRAGALWKHGEAYEYDPTLGAPPACWVSLPLPVGGIPHGLGGGDSAGSGDRELPADCLPGKSLIARVTVRPPSDIAAWAVEEEAPFGWEISGISDGGQFDPRTRRIRWGLFFGNEPKELSYLATAPGHVTSIGRFRGQVSFDGTVFPLGGSGQAVARDGDTEVQFMRLDRDGEGPVRLRIRGGAGQLIVVEHSTDLRRWTGIAPVGLVDGELEFEDLPGAGEKARFYRARPIGP